MIHQERLEIFIRFDLLVASRYSKTLNGPARWSSSLMLGRSVDQPLREIYTKSSTPKSGSRRFLLACWLWRCCAFSSSFGHIQPHRELVWQTAVPLHEWAVPGVWGPLLYGAPNRSAGRAYGRAQALSRSGNEQEVWISHLLVVILVEIGDLVQLEARHLQDRSREEVWKSQNQKTHFRLLIQVSNWLELR